jgi:hypothetical protein
MYNSGSKKEFLVLELDEDEPLICSDALSSLPLFQWKVKNIWQKFYVLESLPNFLAALLVSPLVHCLSY